jgi:hypothetical protein
MNAYMVENVHLAPIYVINDLLERTYEEKCCYIVPSIQNFVKYIVAEETIYLSLWLTPTCYKSHGLGTITWVGE